MQPALIVIDAQQEYFEPYGQWVVDGGPEALANINRLLKVWRARNWPVIHLVHEALDPQSPVFRARSAGVLIHPQLDIAAGEPVLTKHFPGAFTQTPLDAYLSRAGADTVVITGFQTHHCCDATTRQARERGYRCLFIDDATATRNLSLRGTIVSAAEIQRATCAAMTGFAEILHTGEVTAAAELEEPAF